MLLSVNAASGEGSLVYELGGATPGTFLVSPDGASIFISTGDGKLQKMSSTMSQKMSASQSREAMRGSSTKSARSKDAGQAPADTSPKIPKYLFPILTFLGAFYWASQRQSQPGKSSRGSDSTLGLPEVTTEPFASLMKDIFPSSRK